MSPIFDEFRHIFKFPMEFPSGVFSVGISVRKWRGFSKKKSGSSIKPSESELEKREKFVNRERTRGKIKKRRGRTVKIIGDW